MRRAVILSLVLMGCGTAAASAPAPRVARWAKGLHLSGPLDVVGPRSDGAMVVAANGRLWTLRRSLRPFAPGYRSNPGLEAYIALSPGGCYGRDRIYALHLSAPRGVSVIDARGRVRHFATVSAPGLLSGIAFGRRLWVTVNHGSTTTVVTIGCHGGVHVVTKNGPRVEGGIAVAPASFGRFAGDLVAPDEMGGNVYAITPGGRTMVVAASRLPHGPDTGVESEGFLPARGKFEALLADRGTPGNPHPGDDVLLRIGSAALRKAGARPGDLLVAGEGGAQTDAIHCTSRGCQVRRVAVGPAVTHAEGHIAFR